MKFQNCFKKIFFAGIVLAFLAPFSLAAVSDETDILKVLNTYYSASKAKNVDMYVSLFDPLFIAGISDSDSFKGYVSGAFKEFDTLSYKISNSKVKISDNLGIVYYDLNGKVRIAETGEEKDVDNSMVAVFWKYPDGWKIRYTMLQSIYDQKIEAGIISQASMSNAMDSEDNETLKAQMIAEGTYKAEIEAKLSEAAAEMPKISPELLETTNAQTNAKKSNSPSGNDTIVWLIVTAVVIVAAGVAGYFMLRKKGK
jgi:hypothetical protein